MISLKNLKRAVVSVLAVGVVAVLLTLPGASPTPAIADQVGGVTVTVNGSLVSFPDQQPYLDSDSNRVFVPLRFVSQALGCQVYWQRDAMNTATVTRAAHVIEMAIGSAQPTVDGQAVTIDAPAVIANGRTMVPLRFISEAFGDQVNWDSSSKTVSITDGYLTSNTYTMNGYTVPDNTPVTITDSNDPNTGAGVDIQMVVHMDTHQGTPEDLQAEWATVQEILSQKFDTATVQSVMAYVETKTSLTDNVPDKQWHVNGKTISVQGAYNSDCYITVSSLA
ncbi:MAG: copper amine oxidase N-terminal domain-containing protein [Dehalococcoidia bacterium]